MTVLGRVQIYVLVIALYASSLQGMFPNQTQNDPLPLFSSVYPNAFLATRQKAELMRYDYTYEPARWRVSISGFRQYANRARDDERNVIYPGDLRGRWNMLAFFYDPALRKTLYQALNINGNPPTQPGTAAPNQMPSEQCKLLVEDARFSDDRDEFGFFSIPLLYRKYGVRFETEFLLIDRCFYAVGLMIQWGVNDIRQTVTSFNDMTCQALGKACPAAARGITTTGNDICPMPHPVAPDGITPPFVKPTAVPPCMNTACNANNQQDCAVPLQPFEPCCDQKVCLSFPADCKQFVIENIMNQRDAITDIIGLNTCNYHKVGMDDLRVSTFWRQLFVMNEDDERYPRLIFMPFTQVGVGIPMMKPINNLTVFALPNGNNRHPFVAGRAGFTLDFLDTIDIAASGSFSYFFERDYCDYPLPTNEKESGIFPYRADIKLRPGPTWNFNASMHAHHFLDNLSVWAAYSVVSHTNDKITVCKSYIPENSIYFNQGFDVKRAECFSKWESHLINVGFNYDLYTCLSIGAVWQAPVKQRNSYRSGMVLGTLSLVY